MSWARDAEEAEAVDRRDEPNEESAEAKARGECQSNSNKSAKAGGRTGRTGLRLLGPTHLTNTCQVQPQNNRRTGSGANAIRGRSHVTVSSPKMVGSQAQVRESRCGLDEIPMNQGVSPALTCCRASVWVQDAPPHMSHGDPGLHDPETATIVAEPQPYDEMAMLWIRGDPIPPPPSQPLPPPLPPTSAIPSDAPQLPPPPPTEPELYDIDRLEAERLRMSVVRWSAFCLVCNTTAVVVGAVVLKRSIGPFVALNFFTLVGSGSD
jgi:hypothetical protein